MKNSKILKSARYFENYKFHKHFTKIYDEFNKFLKKLNIEDTDICLIELRNFCEIDIILSEIKNYLTNDLLEVKIAVLHSQHFGGSISSIQKIDNSYYKNQGVTNNINLIEKIKTFTKKNFNSIQLENYDTILKKCDQLKAIIEKFFEEYETDFNSIDIKKQKLKLLKKRGKRNIYLDLNKYKKLLKLINENLLYLEEFMINILDYYINYIFQIQNKNYALIFQDSYYTTYSNDIKDKTEWIEWIKKDIDIRYAFIYMLTSEEGKIKVKEIKIDLSFPFVFSLTTKIYSKEKWLDEKIYLEYPEKLSSNTICKIIDI